ncbi:MAG: alpha-galactosidase [Ilumatobacteraceae bacterium]|nr:alpha-galactosidase [Ilumatobacteraceae bacterium]
MIHLRGRHADVVLDTSTGAPTIVHWGAPLGDVDLDALVAALERPITNGMLDVVAPISVVPEHGSGFVGSPGLQGNRRRGVAWAPRFGRPTVQAVSPSTVVVTATDDLAGLSLETTVQLDDVLRVRCALTNLGDIRYLLDHLSVTLPVPSHADELLTFTGRWTRELHAQRTAWPTGSTLIENRRGRTSHEHVPLVFACERNGGEWHGEVWGAHLAWSGNHRVLAERLPDGRRYVQLGELLHAGEVVLLPGERYETPEVIATYGQGLTRASWGFHRSLRAVPAHPLTPRKVLLNTWEAVYFDHDLDTLRRLADAAAAVGVERFVLDDGWFGSRRNDRSGLGDWVVSSAAHPNGLAPIIDHVTSLGMDFGIWVEPEMVNPDSDLFRAHPEWALATDGYEPVLGRQQLVLNLAEPGAYDHVLGQLDALLRDHRIAYVKWDMNRDHVQGSGTGGAAGTHEQTLALYRLLDQLRARHPTVEIESCASGGGRIDHEILRRTERVWTSDCNDALERQTIQRGASMFITPEVMGAHIGPPRSHTTGRVHTLAFRAATAMFGHLGIEWNLLDLDERERADLAQVIAVHRRFRPLLHSGDVVRFDAQYDGVGQDGQAVSHAHGVYAADRSEAVVAFVQLRTGTSLAPPPLRLPDLEPTKTYRVQVVELPRSGRVPARRQPAWVRAGIELTGRQLATHGLQMPVLNPESALLLWLS